MTQRLRQGRLTGGEAATTVDGMDVTPPSLPGAAPASPPTRSLLGRLARFLLPFLIAVAAALAIQGFAGRLYAVEQTSMAETLAPGDILVGEKLTPRIGELAYGDIVVFTLTDGPVPGRALIKRVVGLPGDTLRIADAVLYRNGEAQLEPYVHSANGTQPLGFGDAWTLGEGEYFLLGDHRDGSTDSRTFGPVPLAAIEARVLLRVAPLDTFGAP
jgi:signal peptidase I